VKKKDSNLLSPFYFPREVDKPFTMTPIIYILIALLFRFLLTLGIILRIRILIYLLYFFLKEVVDFSIVVFAFDKDFFIFFFSYMYILYLSQLISTPFNYFKDLRFKSSK